MIVKNTIKTSNQNFCEDRLIKNEQAQHLGPVDKLDLERGMKKNHSERGEKQQAGQSLSMFFDAIMSDFTHIFWTRAILSLNALEKAYGGQHRGAVSACSGIILNSRRARNQFVNRS